MNSGKVLLGVLAGLAAGALLGVLFAPEKGSDTRKKISKKGEDYADSLKENQTSCINCGALLDLEPQEIESGEYTCPECGEKNKISNPQAEKKEVKALLENDSFQPKTMPRSLL